MWRSRSGWSTRTRVLEWDEPDDAEHSKRDLLGEGSDGGALESRRLWVKCSVFKRSVR